MIYKFTSKASGDVIMLGTHGDELMRLLGREPAARGIIEVAAMPLAMRALQSAAVAEGAAAPSDQGKIGTASDEAAGEVAVALRQRLWPMLEMLRRCHAAAEPLVWGV